MSDAKPRANGSGNGNGGAAGAGNGGAGNRDAAKLVLELYVLGRSPRSESAIENLRRICARRRESDAELSLQIIDVLEHPQAAEEARIVATPTLLRRGPEGLHYVVGDLSETSVVLRALGLGVADEGRHAPATTVTTGPATAAPTATGATGATGATSATAATTPTTAKTKGGEEG